MYVIRPDLGLKLYYAAAVDYSQVILKYVPSTTKDHNWFVECFIQWERTSECLNILNCWNNLIKIVILIV